jgi:hypothetical protein
MEGCKQQGRGRFWGGIGVGRCLLSHGKDVPDPPEWIMGRREAARSTTPLILFDDLSVVIYRCLRHAYTFSE